MRTQAYKNEISYIITIDDDVFEMDSKANLPNGVNLYIGKKNEINRRFFGKRIALRDLPEGVLEGIKIRKEIIRRGD